jgi:tRNA A-37 threonylcarbamoyl transferase component Bud32
MVLGGDYELKDKLASGGMAEVFLAYQRSLDRTVAIKVLSPRLSRDPAFIERFRQEGRNIGQERLHHPNILDVYSFGVESGLAYIPMRFVPGGTLKDLLQALGGPMDLQTAARVTGQVASALQHAHDLGMVHLDVKPGNILLGDADWPLLADFGIVRMAGDVRPDGHRVAGTPAYMSPEQWTGGEIDGRSDEYSLALMFYELVTGQRPFHGETSEELKSQHLSAAPPPPRQINPGIPGPVEAVVLRALAKDPDERFPTIDEFGRALGEAVERSRGMQLETKQQLVSVVPNLLALLVLSMVAPLLESLPNPDLPVLGQLTLNWPIALVIAILQVALLLGIRWQIVGLASRLVGTLLDSLDRFTRIYVRLGTDAEGPLHVAHWRNAALATVEGLVNIAYLFIVYALAAVPLINTVALPIDPGLEDVIATALTAVVLLAAGSIVLRVYLASGPIIAVCVLAICWAFLSALPVLDARIAGEVSAQWLVKLLIGLAILGAFLAVRGRVQGVARQFVTPFVRRQVRSLRRGVGAEEVEARVGQSERAVDGIVDVAYLVLGYALIAAPLWEVLVALVSPIVAAAVITVAVLVLAGGLINLVRGRAGQVAAALALVICAPTLLGLPLFRPDAVGTASFVWVGRLVVGAIVLLLFLGVRRSVQSAGRPFLARILAQQIAALRPSHSEAEESQRRALLGETADAVVDLLYVVVGYLAIVAPVTAALVDLGSLATVSTLIYILFVAAVLWVLYRLARDVLPIVRPVPVPA